MLSISGKLTVFLELGSRKTVRFSEQVMSADKYPSIFSRQMEAIVYLSSYITRFLDLCPQPQVRPWEQGCYALWVYA